MWKTIMQQGHEIKLFASEWNMKIAEITRKQFCKSKFKEEMWSRFLWALNYTQKKNKIQTRSHKCCISRLSNTSEDNEKQASSSRPRPAFVQFTTYGRHRCNDNIWWMWSCSCPVRFTMSNHCWFQLLEGAVKLMCGCFLLKQKVSVKNWFNFILLCL